MLSASSTPSCAAESLKIGFFLGGSSPSTTQSNYLQRRHASPALCALIDYLRQERRSELRSASR
jgi:hypothetical protein